MKMKISNINWSYLAIIVFFALTEIMNFSSNTVIGGFVLALPFLIFKITLFLKKTDGWILPLKIAGALYGALLTFFFLSQFSINERHISGNNKAEIDRVVLRLSEIDTNKYRSLDEEYITERSEIEERLLKNKNLPVEIKGKKYVDPLWMNSGYGRPENDFQKKVAKKYSDVISSIRTDQKQLRFLEEKYNGDEAKNREIKSLEKERDGLTFSGKSGTSSSLRFTFSLSDQIVYLFQGLRSFDVKNKVEKNADDSNADTYIMSNGTQYTFTILDKSRFIGEIFVSLLFEFSIILLLISHHSSKKRKARTKNEGESGDTVNQDHGRRINSLGRSVLNAFSENKLTVRVSSIFEKGVVAGAEKRAELAFKKEEKIEEESKLKESATFDVNTWLKSILTESEFMDLAGDYLEKYRKSSSMEDFSKEVVDVISLYHASQYIEKASVYASVSASLPTVRDKIFPMLLEMDFIVKDGRKVKWNSKQGIINARTSLDSKWIDEVITARQECGLKLVNANG